MGHVTGFVFLCLPEELRLACRADRTVSSSLIVFEQKLFETVSEDPHLCDCGCSNVWGKNWVRMIPNTWRSVCSLFGVMMMRRVVQDVFFFFFFKMLMSTCLVVIILSFGRERNCVPLAILRSDG